MLREAGASSPFLGYQPSFAADPLPRRDLRLRQRRDRARHPGRLPAARRRPGQHRLRRHSDGWAGDAAISFTVGTPAPRDLRLIDTTRAGPGRGHRGGRGRQPDRRHLPRDRHRRARRRLRHPGRLRRPRHRPPHARGPARSPTTAAPAAASASATAWSSPSSPCSWPAARTTTTRTRRLDPAHHRRQPSRPHRAHGGHHRRGAAHPDRPLASCAGSGRRRGGCGRPAGAAA